MTEVERRIYHCWRSGSEGDFFRRRHKRRVEQGQEVGLSTYIPEFGFLAMNVKILESGHEVMQSPRHLRGVGAYTQEHESYSPRTRDLYDGPVGYDDDYVRLEYRLPYEVRRLVHVRNRRNS